ncbi:hypothetical protein LTR62_005630 [Meristemomyces frigidus]|uniref:IQ calmodulin-binding motif domain protein n=1 Tax=Meristemomyces frigidus TaxID=1508187 RepID=A0AAN7TCN3_9PEZI|nr:hypothetical protein LTR62_005630 [Meristemomyces frigidus]
MGAPDSDQRREHATNQATTTAMTDTTSYDSDMPHPQDDDGFTTPPPPPHIAARFYRNRPPYNMRRKSSATSSRRNSLSSAHSRASSISRRHSTAGTQSYAIAQHLRRASIIESRKARLADRAVHAEQVRLRAALAKAQPRGNNASEERALAASIAKEKYLAKVAATCAEEVARAKRIAEEVKERKLAEEARQRSEMEERHAEAEKRRQEFQRNLQARRVRRADSCEKKLAVVEELGDVVEEAIEGEEEAAALSNDAAALRIQRAWRLARQRAVILAFERIGLAQAGLISFEDLTALIAKTEIIDTTTAYLMQLGLQDRGDDNAALNTRTFLSAYMMTAHPAFVLMNKNGAQEQDLLAKAAELLSLVETTSARLAAWNDYAPSETQLETLSQSYSSYTSAFAAWRLQDSSVLIEGMIASFVELDAIWQTVKDDDRGEVASDFREGIRDNQVMLLSRIRKLAGADRADTLIKKAIKESRRRRPKKRNAAEVRPRNVELLLTQEDTSITGTIVQLDEVAQAVGLVESRSATDVTRRLFTPMPSNRVLTHELAIDKDYKLTDASAALREEMYRSICAAMREGFEAGEGFLWTISAAENVREKLLRMLKPGQSMYTIISESLDLENVARQSRAGVFSYEGFFRFMANVLPKLCAPFRDQEIATLATELQEAPAADGQALDTMIDKLFKLLRAVDTLSLDYTNFMIMNVAPTLIREAAGYEQRSFAADLETGTITLEKTKRWWRSSYEAMTAEADRRDPDGVRLAADSPRPETIYARALVDLVLDQGQLEIKNVPETLSLDHARLVDLRAQGIRITIIGAVLLTAKNLLKRDVRAQWKSQAARLWLLLSAEPYTSSSSAEGEGEGAISTAQKAFSILETANNMPASSKQHLQSTILRYFSQAQSGLRFSDPVLKVLFQRLRTHALNRLNASTSSERVRAASSASETLAGFGLGELTGQVGGMVEVLERVRKVDWEGHGGWYARVTGEGV